MCKFQEKELGTFYVSPFVQFVSGLLDTVSWKFSCISICICRLCTDIISFGSYV